MEKNVHAKLRGKKKHVVRAHEGRSRSKGEGYLLTEVGASSRGARVTCTAAALKKRVVEN